MVMISSRRRDEIFNLRAQGETISGIARAVGSTRQTVRAVLRRESDGSEHAPPVRLQVTSRPSAGGPPGGAEDRLAQAHAGQAEAQANLAILRTKNEAETIQEEAQGRREARAAERARVAREQERAEEERAHRRKIEIGRLRTEREVALADLRLAMQRESARRHEQEREASAARAAWERSERDREERQATRKAEKAKRREEERLRASGRYRCRDCRTGFVLAREMPDCPLCGRNLDRV